MQQLSLSTAHRPPPPPPPPLPPCRSTPHSLVILDELGRGTSTGDGAAIAAAVLDHCTQRIGCRGMFATHYHHISGAVQRGVGGWGWGGELPSR